MARSWISLLLGALLLAGCGQPALNQVDRQTARHGAGAPWPAPGGEPSSGAIQVFFTDTYSAATGGMSTKAASAANQRSAEADPANPDKRLAALIASAPAGSTLDGAFYDIQVADVVDAFAAAARRGVRVRLVTDSSYYADKQGGLRAPIQTLQAAGVAVKSRPASLSGLMHDKFLVLNGQTVWTGSYNISDGGSYADNNNALCLASPGLAAAYEAEFSKLFDREDFRPGGHPAPAPVSVGGATVTPYFSPVAHGQPGARDAILAELRQARRSIHFLAYAFTDAAMGEAMAAKAAEGVPVAGVFERSQATNASCQYSRLAASGAVDARLDNNPGLMHHKVILVDDETLIVGSFNFSENAEASNNENMLVIKHCPALVAAYEAEFERILAASSAEGAVASKGRSRSKR